MKEYSWCCTIQHYSSKTVLVRKGTCFTVRLKCIRKKESTSFKTFFCSWIMWFICIICVFFSITLPPENLLEDLCQFESLLVSFAFCFKNIKLFVLNFKNLENPSYVLSIAPFYSIWQSLVINLKSTEVCHQKMITKKDTNCFLY